MQRTTRYGKTWKSWLIIVIVSVSLTLLVSQCEPANSVPPRDTQSFIKHFKAGDYKRWPAHYAYANSFRRTWIRVAQRSYRGATFRPRREWRQFKTNDTCASYLINAPDCTWSGGPNLKTPYWENRRNTQDRWTLRVIWCGGVGVGTFATGGTVAAAVGPGSLACFGTWFIS